MSTLKKDPITMQRARLGKAVISTIRLKHSLAADEEINDRVPAIIASFDLAIAKGEAYELNTLSILESMDEPNY